MATELDITGGVVRAQTGVVSTLFQIMTLSIDVSKSDQADLLLWVHGVEGAVTNFTLSIIGGMTLESEDGWVTLATFADTHTANSTATVNVPKLFKYLRWKVTTMTGGTAVSFSLRGMARGN